MVYVRPTSWNLENLVAGMKMDRKSKKDLSRLFDWRFLMAVDWVGCIFPTAPSVQNLLVAISSQMPLKVKDLVVVKNKESSGSFSLCSMFV